jgi:Pleckstrin homology domain
MNPLCCIAPVSLDPIDSAGTGAPPLISPKPRPLPLPSTAKPLALTQSPTKPGELVASQVIEEARSSEAGHGAVVVTGLLYKWVNYGKGWRSRWFVLEDGVLSYYKVHGPDKISVGPVCGANAGVRVIGEDSLRRVRRDQAFGSTNGRKWKPFGEIHLKVRFLNDFFISLLDCTFLRVKLYSSFLGFDDNGAREVENLLKIIFPYLVNFLNLIICSPYNLVNFIFLCQLVLTVTH